MNKKEAKKTLLIWVRAGSNARGPDSESFLLLFFKKEALSFHFYWLSVSMQATTLPEHRDFASRRAIN
ncbi:MULTISPECIES: hypothetical protein [Acidiphilium]|uniref:hypothetical protein n=1 Tax=Acidiphilium TaxID=522 RepID=UPI00257F4BCF|nr:MULTISPECIES: hypothetical protein [Acidiphilium]HQT86337.1 hypothetical protein [Acidiphilium rubrum]